MDIQTAFTTSPLILAECAVAERLRRTDDIKLHPTLFNTPLIYDSHGRREMEAIYRQYRDIAIGAKLPILLCAPTWRVDRVRLAEAGFDESLIFGAVNFMCAIREQQRHPDSAMIVGGLIGPKNDCYKPEEALEADEAEDYHWWQIERLALAGTDCIIAQTLPALSEALGIARALARSSVPALISFVIDRHARILDGTPLCEAIALIDAETFPRPLGYMVNCVYPTFLDAENQPPSLFNRLIGIQANSSSLDHTRLDGSTILHQDDLQHWGETMLRLNSRHRVRILGGCCGTDDTYLRFLADHRIGHMSTHSS